MRQWVRKRKDRSGIIGSQQVYRDVMIDIETLGTGLKAKILNLGAVRFRPDTSDDWDTLNHEDRSFYVRFDEDDQVGRVTEKATLDWWEQQSDEAREVFNEDRTPTKEGLLQFVAFCRGAKRIWGNGNVFDNTKVRNLCEDFDVEYPVPFWGDLDMRTLTWLWNKLTGFIHGGSRPMMNKSKKVAHNALADAQEQVRSVQKMWSQIRGTKYGPEE